MALKLSLPERFNVADHFILPRLAAGAGARPYLICGEERLTVAALHAQASRAAHAFTALGLRPGQRVALLMHESLAFPVCFWGAVRAGLLPVPLNTALTAADYRFYLDDSRARGLVVDAALWPTVSPLLAELPALRHVLLAGAGPFADVPPPGRTPHVAPLAEALAGAEPDFATRLAHPDAPAFWLYTSGSTGRPKATVHRQRDMVYVTETYLRQVLQMGPEDVSFSAAKLFFAYGLGNSLYFPLAAGCTAVIQPQPATARACFATLARHRPTVFHAVPTLYNAMLRLHEAWRAGQERPPRPLPRLEHLRLATSGGEPLPPAVLDGWQAAFGVPILDGIGSTEALHFYVANRPGRVIAGSTGLPVPGYDVRVVGRAGRDAAPGETGELWVRGGSVMARYWRQPARTRRALRAGGWLATGDRFRREADGSLWYEGRADDLLKVGGSWLNPVEVEHALLTHPAVAECAVVGRPDAAGLTKALACVVLGTGWRGDAALADALRAHVGARLAAFKVPQWVQFLPALPKTATGKIQRFRLREGGTPGAAAQPVPPTVAATPSGTAAAGA